MNLPGKHILYIATGIGLVSMIYFISLMAHMPFIATVIFVFLTLGYLGFKWRPDKEQKSWRIGFFASLILLAGMAIITNKVYYLAPKYGEWDAWAIWNLHAKYLLDSNNWGNLFKNKAFAHADYPLCVPSAIAFFTRLFKTDIDTIAFGFHFLITLCIPVLIFLETYRRSIIIAGVVLILMATNEFYLTQGVSQYADTLLGLYFLSALVAVRYRHHKYMVTLTAFMLGCCIWTKNEGMILAGIFILFYLDILLKRANLKSFLIGIAFPLIIWLTFKICYAPHNDILAGQSKDTLSYLFKKERYRQVYESFKENLRLNFRDVKYGLVIYVILSLIKRRILDRQMLIILACCLAYLGVYVLTPKDLGWHLFTSQNRLMHQLMPAAMYVLAMSFSALSGSNQPEEDFSVRPRPL